MKQTLAPTAEHPNRIVREGKSFSLRADLVYELEVAAAKKRLTQSSIVEEAIEAWLDGDRRRPIDPAQMRLGAAETT